MQPDSCRDDIEYAGIGSVLSRSEKALIFECSGNRLIGIFHQPVESRTTGFLFIVGGPQFRVGSHRQFVLMARSLSDAGYPVLRFDYRGMGDSEGTLTGFRSVRPDIESALMTLLDLDDTIENVVLLGLCDAASAAMINCGVSSKISGLILINPWARTETGEAKAFLRHYYLRRPFQKSFWSGVFSGRYKLKQSALGLMTTFWSAYSGRRQEQRGSNPDTELFVDSMRLGLEQFSGKVMILLSEHDLTAAEFEDLYQSDHRWKKVMSATQMEYQRIPGADHTFSKRTHLLSAVDYIIRWVRKMDEAEQQ